jgi:voltage-gated potassium channel
MTDQAEALPQHGNAYNIFILVLTVVSLAVMVLLILPLDPETLQLLRVYDNLICVVFLADFLGNMAMSKPTRAYFIGRRGWLDLLGSIPSFGFFPAAGLFRLARLSRLSRIARLLQGKNKTQLVDDVLNNRGQYAAFITVLSGFLVLVTASVLVLQFEAANPDANITTGGDALWWALVTITTVGYGDTFPTTMLGRATGVFVMFAGIGIIGALASILASILVPDDDEAATPASAAASSPDPIDGDAIATELARLRAEVTALRASLERM